MKIVLLEMVALKYFSMLFLLNAVLLAFVEALDNDEVLDAVLLLVSKHTVLVVEALVWIEDNMFWIESSF